MSAKRQPSTPAEAQWRAGASRRPALTIRQARDGDVPAITEVFNQGVEDGMATLDPPHSVGQRLSWFRAHGHKEPVLVAESDGLLVGWASLSQYSPRMCYDSTKELSIYVRREWRGKGVGGALLGRLLHRGQELGLHKVVLFCLPSNWAGVELYRKHGFVDVGIFHHHGVRDGIWHDILAMERHLVND